MRNRYRPLIDYIAAQHEKTLTLSFDDIDKILGSPLSEDMRTNARMWGAIKNALVWRLEAHGWHARLDRHGHCVHFVRDAEEVHTDA